MAQSRPEWSPGRTVKAAPKKTWSTLQAKIRTIVLNYDEYKDQERVSDFLRAIASSVVIV